MRLFKTRQNFPRCERRVPAEGGAPHPGPRPRHAQQTRGVVAGCPRGCPRTRPLRRQRGARRGPLVDQLLLARLEERVGAQMRPP